MLRPVQFKPDGDPSKPPAPGGPRKATIAPTKKGGKKPKKGKRSDKDYDDA